MFIPDQLASLGSQHDIRMLVMSYLRANLTEEKTDEWISLLKRELDPHLPWWVPMSFVTFILDRLVPEAVLDAIDDLLREI